MCELETLIKKGMKELLPANWLEVYKTSGGDTIYGFDGVIFCQSAEITKKTIGGERKFNGWSVSICLPISESHEDVVLESLDVVTVAETFVMEVFKLINQNYWHSIRDEQQARQWEEGVM